MSRLVGAASGNAVTALGDPNLLFYEDAWNQFANRVAERSVGRADDIAFNANTYAPLSTRHEYTTYGGATACDPEDAQCDDPFRDDSQHYYAPRQTSAATGQVTQPTTGEEPLVRRQRLNFTPASSPDNVYVPTGGHRGGGGGGGLRGGGETVMTQETSHANHCATPDLCKEGMLPGCNLVSNNEIVWAHRKLNQTREPGTKVDEVVVQTAARGDYATSNAHMVNSAHTQPYGSYTDDLYRTPTLDSERRISTGVMVNPYTGQMYETYEDDLPPPDTDKSIEPDLFKRTSYKLLQMKGMIDPNRAEPTKREVCKRLPGTDGGANVWGDQLYADRRRNEMQQLQNRTVWLNRDGDYMQGAWDTKAMGYVGYQRAYQNFPYMPPTQTLDSDQWVSAPSEQNRMPSQARAMMESGQGDDPYRVVGHVTTKRVDASQCARSGHVDVGGAGFGEGTGFQGEERPTLKRLMQRAYPTANANLQDTGEGTGFQGEERPTLKRLMQRQYPTANANLENTGEGTGFQGEERPTLKRLMQRSYPTANAQLDDAGETVGFQGDTRMTKKNLMQAHFPTLNAQLDDAGGVGQFEHGIVEIHNYRGCDDSDTSAFFPISHVPVDGGDQGRVAYGRSERSTKREQCDQNVARPSRYSENSPRWLPDVAMPCLQKGDAQVEYVSTHPTRFGSMTMADA